MSDNTMKVCDYEIRAISKDTIEIHGGCYPQTVKKQDIETVLKMMEPIKIQISSIKIFDEVIVVKDKPKDIVVIGCTEVTRQELQDILKLMENYNPKPKFSVGDYVKVVRLPSNPEVNGKYGKIIEKRGINSSDVEFAEFFQCMADYSTSKAPRGHGWVLANYQLELVN